MTRRMFQWALVAMIATFSGCVHDPFGLLDQTLDWKTVESEHFVFYYLTDDPDAYVWRNQYVLVDGTDFDAASVSIEQAVEVYLDQYEALFEAYATVFEDQPRTPIRIYSYNSWNQMSRIGGGSAGAWIDYAKSNGDDLAIHQAKTGVISHELVHLFQVQAGTAGVCWMEGGANALAGGAISLLDVEPYLRIDLRPSLPLDKYPTPVIPYAQLTTQNAVFSAPVHPAAALKMGLHADPAYPVSSGSLWTDIRPSDVDSWVNVMTRSGSIPYIMCASFVHHLVETHGWAPYMKLYRQASASGMMGRDLETVFRRAYGMEIEAAEAAWIDWLRSKPIAHFDAKFHFRWGL